MAKKVETRFILRHNGVDEPLPKHETPLGVVSKAITRATMSKKPGVWEVIEHEDVMYRIRRLDSPKLDVRVETVR